MMKKNLLLTETWSAQGVSLRWTASLSRHTPWRRIDETSRAVQQVMVVSLDIANVNMEQIG